MKFFQLLIVTHPKIHAQYFLHISKAFDKIWIPGLIFKFESFRISGDLLELIKNILWYSYQKLL